MHTVGAPYRVILRNENENGTSFLSQAAVREIERKVHVLGPSFGGVTSLSSGWYL